MQVSRLCLAVSVVLPSLLTEDASRGCAPQNIFWVEVQVLRTALYAVKSWTTFFWRWEVLTNQQTESNTSSFFFHRWSLGDILVRLYATTWQPRGCYYSHANILRDSSRLRVQYSGVLSPGWVEMQSCKNRSSIDVGGFPPDFRVLRSMIYLTDFTS